MKKLLQNRWTRLALALCMSMALLSTAAFAVEGDTSSGGSTATVISAFQAGFQSMASDAMQMIAVAAPVAISLAGVIFLSRKAISWFKGMAK